MDENNLKRIESRRKSTPGTGTVLENPNNVGSTEKAK